MTTPTPQPATPHQPTADPVVISRATMQYEDAKKTPAVAWILWLFTGGIGGHRYYLGDTGMGVAMTLTLGGIGLWALIDGLFINRRLRVKNREIRQRIFAANGIPDMA